MNGQSTQAIQGALPSLDLGLRLLAILLAAALLYLPFRRRGRSLRAGALSVFLAGIVYPGFVLGLTYLAQTLELLPVAGRGAAHLVAWSVFWGAVFVIRLINEIVKLAHARRRQQFPIPPLLHRLLLGVLYVAAALVVLRTILNTTITPFLATSAVLTAVVGFALQGVLGNLLAGMSTSLVGTVKVGDLIGLTGVEGRVVHMNWRETILRTREERYVHVPNNTLASELVTNFSKPDALHRFSLDVGASYADAPEAVIATLIEAARESGTALQEPAPQAHVVAYQDFGISYRLHFWSRDYWQRVHVVGEVARHVWYKFKRRGIEIPFPMSDQLLNDFMAVVYNQRRLPPSEADEDRMVEVLRSSEFLTRETEAGAGEPILNEEAVRDLARWCRFLRYTRGEILVRQGEAGDSCFVVVRGEIVGQVEYQEKGSPHRMDFRSGPGKVFGEMSLVTGAPRTATGTFEAETELLEIPGEAFARFLAAHEAVMSEIADIVAERNRANEEFLKKVQELDTAMLQRSVDSGSILSRLRELAGWGRRLMGS